MTSSRVPRSHEPNPWSRALAARRDAGLEVWDLVHPGHFYDVERPTVVIASLIAEPDAFDEAVTRVEALF